MHLSSRPSFAILMIPLRWLMKILRRFFYDNSLVKSFLCAAFFLWDHVKMGSKKSNEKCGEIKGEEKVQGLEPAVHRLYNDGCKKPTETFLPSVESSLVVRAVQAPGPLQTAQAPALSHVSSLSPGSPLVVHDDSSSITISRETDVPGEVRGFDVALTASPVQENISMTKNLLVTDSGSMVKQLRDVHSHFSPISPEANPRYERNETVSVLRPFSRLTFILTFPFRPRHVPRYQINSLTTHFEE